MDPCPVIGPPDVIDPIRVAAAEMTSRPADRGARRVGVLRLRSAESRPRPWRCPGAAPTARPGQPHRDAAIGPHQSPRRDAPETSNLSDDVDIAGSALQGTAGPGEGRRHLWTLAARRPWRTPVGRGASRLAAPRTGSARRVATGRSADQIIVGRAGVRRSRPLTGPWAGGRDGPLGGRGGRPSRAARHAWPLRGPDQRAGSRWAARRPGSSWAGLVSGDHGR